MAEYQINKVNNNAFNDDKSITELGNPGCPDGDAGEAMLARMNVEHFELTSWGINLMDLKDDDTVIDIGSGGGLTIRRISDRVPNGHFAAIDYSDTSIKLTKMMNDALIIDGRMDVIKASVEKLPFEDNTFSKAISVESFYFWPDHVENLKEVRRILKEGGVVSVVCDIYDTEKLTDREKENVKKYNLFNPTLEEFEEIFKMAGFKEVKINTKEGTTWVCAQGIK